MRTLDATLQAAQDGASHQPIVEVISLASQEDVPLAGMQLSATTTGNSGPFAIKSPDTGITQAYANASGNNLVYTYTNPEGTEFHSVTIPLTSTPFGISACVTAEGNIGIVYFLNEGGNYLLKYRIITPTGATVTTAQIASWANTNFTSSTWVSKVPGINNAYIMVYAKGTTIYKRISILTFEDWNSESAITITGVGGNKKDNPSLMTDASNNLWLWFDYVESTSGASEIRNIYYTISTNTGTTFGTAVKITNYNAYNTYGTHPVDILTSATTQMLIYTVKKSLVSHIPSSPVPTSLSSMSYDPITKYLTTHYIYTVIVWDTVSGNQVKRFDTTTVPAICPDISSNSWASNGIESKNGTNFIALVDENARFVDLLNINEETIRQYNFVTATYFYGVRTANVQFSVTRPGSSYTINKFHLDEANRKLWLYWRWDYSVYIGYFDLDDAGPTYTFQNVVNITDRYYLPPGSGGASTFRVYPDDDLILVTHCNSVGGGSGYEAYTLTGESLGMFREQICVDATWRAKNVPYTVNSTIHRNGMKYCCYYQGFIYSTFDYSNYYTSIDRRGLAKTNVLTGETTYHRPTWETTDEYYLYNPNVGPSGKIIMAVYYKGLAVFDIDSDTWTLYDKNKVPGLTGDGELAMYHVLYAPTENMLFLGGYDFGLANNAKVQMFPWEGVLQYSEYLEGLYSGGTWTFTDMGRLVQNNGEFDAVGVVDPLNDQALYIIWQTTDGMIKWGKIGSEINLTSHLLAGNDITIERSITGDNGKLEFTCDNGHLFDRYNVNSLLRIAFIKGRKITVRWGEKVGDTEYWIEAGTFYVTELDVSYEKGVYSTAKIVAEDMRVIWGDKKIWATDYYNDYPENIISDLLTTFTNLTTLDIDLPVFSNRIRLEHQWLDTTLIEILNQICDRFGYYLFITGDNKVSARKISDTNTVNHTYSDNTKLKTFAPDDKFSDFTNKVTVVGQEKTYTEVIYPEERVGAISGTIGWWGGNNTHRINYSEDSSRTCVNPRILVIESAQSMGFAVGELTNMLSGIGSVDGITETITNIDPNDKFCDVTISAPNLTGALIAHCGLLLISTRIPDIVVAAGGGQTIRLGSMITGLESIIVMGILSAIGNYQLEVWATPTGNIKRTVQSSANDTDFQAKIGYIVEKKLEDPLCYTVEDCTLVATNELMVVRLQRNRVKISKITHLQDEDGDTIKVNHPYTNIPLNFFVTNMTRKLKKAPGPDKEGYFLDGIEGWVL